MEEDAGNHALADAQAAPVAICSPPAPAQKARVAHVRFVPGDSHLRLQLRLQNDHRTFFRPVDEKLDKVRYRLQLLAASDAAKRSAGQDNEQSKSKHKKHKKRKNGGGGGVALAAVKFLDASGDQIPCKGASIGDALACTARIVLGEEIFVVLHNQPLVTRLSVLDPVLAGIPSAPLPETEFCDADACSWRWYRLPKGEEHYTLESRTLCSTERRYIPTEHELGCRFYVECHAPAIQSEYAEDSRAEVVTTPVVPGPDRRVFEKRRRLSATPADAKHLNVRLPFRVMSYNVLFDGYATTNHAQVNLFPYVDARAMKEAYRVQLIFQEIEESKSDVVCLQEMGERTFHAFFQPMMASLGFHGFYSGKTGTTLEGCATFVRQEVFLVIEEYTLDLARAVKHSEDPTARSLLLEFPELSKGIDRIPSVAQVLLLRSVCEPGKKVILTNTHLFYREDAHLIRLLQAVALVREVERRRVEPELQDAAVIMCGDWNATPGTAPISFLLNSQIDSSHKHWQQAPKFRWNRSKKANGNGNISKGNGSDSPAAVTVSRGQFMHPLRLESACGTPAFTNFVAGFVGTLDYILADANVLEVREVFPLFSETEVSEEMALPSSKFPSDHISLICDVAWRG